jgi:hypothetical protein
MKTHTQIGGATLAMVLVGSAAFASSNVDLSLEPCINGGVSARGLFASQAEENRYFAARAEQDEKSARIAGE